MRRLLKFLHTIGAVGLMGAMASLLAIMTIAPSPSSPSAYAAVVKAMAAISAWVFFPSLAVTLIAGLLAIAVNPAFHEAGWAWVKAGTGIVLFEGGLLYVAGPLQEEARRSALAMTGRWDLQAAARASSAEWSTLWLLLGVTAANVALGVWRPRFSPRPDPSLR